MAEPHICLVAPGVYPVLSGDRSAEFIGGAEVQQNFIARGLHASGYTVSILTSDFGQPKDVEIDGLRVIRIGDRGRSLPVLRYFHPRLTSLWSALRRADADIYYQRCAAAQTFVTGLYARTRGKRFVFAAASDFDLDVSRNIELFQGRGGWRDRQLFRAGLGLADRVIAQHMAQVETFRRGYGRKAEWIPSGYAVPAGARCEPEGVVLWVSVMRPVKRPELFLQLARLFPHLRFRMIGGVSQASGQSGVQAYFSEIESVARALPNVEFLGFLPYWDADRHFNEACLVINTSHREGFPNTFLQAWARGIPTISFVNCGAKDTLGPIGCIASDLEEMQAGISRLTSDRVYWSEESDRCLQYFRENHSMPAVIARYRSLFDRLRQRA